MAPRLQSSLIVKKLTFIGVGILSLAGLLLPTSLRAQLLQQASEQLMIASPAPPCTEGEVCAGDGQDCTDDVYDSRCNCTHPPKPATTVCRASTAVCDPEEYCNADGLCAADSFIDANSNGVPDCTECVVEVQPTMKITEVGTAQVTRKPDDSSCSYNGETIGDNGVFNIQFDGIAGRRTITVDCGGVQCGAGLVVEPVCGIATYVNGVAGGSPHQGEQVKISFSGTGADTCSVKIAEQDRELLTSPAGDGLISSGRDYAAPAGGSFDIAQICAGNDGTSAACAKTVQILPAECGNKFIEDGEECDDGNNDNTDSCAGSCKNAICSDGYVQAGVEECDDGDLIDDNGCTSSCTYPACGDNILQAGEACDDGNTGEGDGCNSVCQLEPVCKDFNPSSETLVYGKSSLVTVSCQNAEQACVGPQCMGVAPPEQPLEPSGGEVLVVPSVSISNFSTLLWNPQPARVNTDGVATITVNCDAEMPAPSAIEVSCVSSVTGSYKALCPGNFTLGCKSAPEPPKTGETPPVVETPHPVEEPGSEMPPPPANEETVGEGTTSPEPSPPVVIAEIPTGTPPPVTTAPPAAVHAEPRLRVAVCRLGDYEAVFLDNGEHRPIEEGCPEMSLSEFMSSKAADIYRVTDYYLNHQTDAAGLNEVRKVFTEHLSSDMDENPGYGVYLLATSGEGEATPVDHATVVKVFAKEKSAVINDGIITIKGPGAKALSGVDDSGVATLATGKEGEISNKDVPFTKDMLFTVGLPKSQGGGFGCSVSPHNTANWTILIPLFIMGAWRFPLRRRRVSIRSFINTPKRGSSTKK